jgi:hypothetical protein
MFRRSGAKLVSEAERREDPPAELTPETAPGCALDHHSEEDVVRAGVGETLPGPSDWALGQRHTHQLARFPPAPRLGDRPAYEIRVVRIVGKPGRMREQLSHGDPAAVRNESGNHR